MQSKPRIALLMAVILVIGLVGGALASDKFTDVPNDHPFHDEISWMADHDITAGFPDGTFRPSRAVSRQAAAAFLKRYHDNLGADTVNADTLDAATPIAMIGGSINDRNTNLGVELTDLPPGDYVVDVDGAFMLSEDASWDSTTSIWPQISLQIDQNCDGEFTWQDGEGDISPNALMPEVAERHIAVSGSTVVSLAENEACDGTPDLRLLGFGYTSTGGSEGSGEIDVVHALLTAAKIDNLVP